ncbi:MAG: replication-relaxation family protein, partial [Armatimonadota bacterium]|nr:replication-relaxation family protein [Armatimonadota bacterium]
YGYAVEGWRYELPIREDVDDPDQKVPPLVLRPDAYFTLLVGQRRLHLFLEVDMGTESHGRFGAKTRRYLAYKQSTLFRARFGGRSFRVLVVAPTVTRMRSLKRLTESQGGQRMFWFAPLSDITAEKIVEPIWQLAGESAKARLFGSIAAPPQADATPAPTR